MKRFIPIRDAVEITNNRVARFSGGRRYLATGDLDGNLIDETTIVDYETKPSRADLLVDEGDIIVARMQATNKVLLTDKKTKDLIVSTGFLTLSPKKGFDSNFLAHYFRSHIFQGQKDRYCSGSTQRAISNGSFSKITIPYYPVNEQKKIAKMFDCIDKLRQKRKEAIRLADEFLKSAFIEMFGDPVRNPKKWHQLIGEECCKKISVGVVVKPASHYVSKGVVALRSQNIKANRIDLNDIVYFSKEAHNGILSKSTLKTGDVVVVRTGSTGTAAVVTKELNGVNCIDLIIVRPKTDLINPFYLSFLLNSERGKWLVSSREVGGIQKHFNIGALNGMKIPAPPISLQNEFLKALNLIESLKQKMLAQSEELHNLFNSLMQRVFG